MNGVNATGISTELLLGLVITNDVYKEFDHELIVTSLIDGTHSKTSLHYAGNAADLRTRDFPPGMAQAVRDAIIKALPNDFDVILESDHIHLEWQPRRRS